MNIDEVLLTLKQVRNIRELADKIAVNHGLRGDEYLKFKDDAQDKAQCLKLLELVKVNCREHSANDWLISKRFLRELESKLKEG